MSKHSWHPLNLREICISNYYDNVCDDLTKEILTNHGKIKMIHHILKY